MSLRVNWKKLNAIKNDLINEKGLSNDSLLKFVFILPEGQSQSKNVKIKEFLPLFWKLENVASAKKIIGLIVTDTNGNLVYKHKQITVNEEIPSGGNPWVISQWKTYNQTEKDKFVELIIASINAE